MRKYEKSRCKESEGNRAGTDMGADGAAYRMDREGIPCFDIIFVNRSGVFDKLVVSVFGSSCHAEEDNLSADNRDNRFYV